MKRRWGITAALVSVTAAILPAHAFADDLSSAIERLRAATERFQDVNVALAEGYIPDPSGHCVTAGAEGLPPELGGMGVHYLRMDLLGVTASEPRVDGTGTHTDFDEPAILLYMPQEDGSMVLVGAENLVFKKAWEDAGNSAPPQFAGRTWDYMEDDPNTPGDEAHGFAPHYDQHVYFNVADASAAVQPFNPAVNCDHHSGH